MDCIKYINDLNIEIQILEDLKKSDVSNIKELNQKIELKKELLKKCKSNLDKLSDNQICYRIYSNILNGLTLSKSIEKVAEENYINGIKPCSTNAIWVNYYPSLKKILKIY